MNILVRYFKAILTAGLLTASIIASLPTVYSFDFARPDLTVTQFLDSLSFNYKGIDVKVTGVSIGETFDDNVTFANKDKINDFITDAGGGVRVTYEKKTMTLELIGNANNRTYEKNSDFDNITEDITLNFKNEFSEFDRISLKNVFTHSDAPLFFREDFFNEQFGRTGGRFDYFRNKSNANYSRDVTKQLTVIARYANDIDMFSGVDLQNSMQNKAGFELDYIFSSATIFYFSYDFTHREFEEGKNAVFNTITPGVRQYFTKKIYFDGKIGVDFIDSFDDKKLIKPNVQSSLNYEIVELTRLSLLFTKKYDTNPYTEDLFNNWRTSLSFSRQLLERLGCSLSLFYGDGEYISSNSTQKLMGASPIFTYDINKNLKGNLTYTYSQLDSNFESSGYTKNTVFLGFVAEF